MTSKSKFKAVKIDGVQVLVSPTSITVERFGRINEEDLRSGSFLKTTKDGTPMITGAPPKPSA